MKKMFGICTAIVTPFDQSNHVDFDVMRNHIDFLISKGVHNLYPLGTMGEAALMTIEEREEVAEKVVDYVAGRVGVFIQIGALSQNDAVRLARHAHSIGADGIGAISPYFYHEVCCFSGLLLIARHSIKFFSFLSCQSFLVVL